MNGTPLGQIVFSGARFPRKFYVQEVERGIYRYIEELPGRVMEYTTDEGICAALVDFMNELPAGFEFYKFDKRKAMNAVEYWACLKASRFEHDIAAVLEAHQLDKYCFHRLDFSAAPGKCELFDNFLSRMSTNRKAFCAMIGALFDPNFSRQFYVWLHGPGGDGKGTILRFLKRVFGRAYMALPADFKQHNQFFSSRLVGKRIGAFQDCHNPKLVQSELFMQLTGGDPMMIEEKNKQPYMAELQAVVWVSSNFEPAITGSEAHKRRLVYCKLEKGDMDGDKTTYSDRLWEERAAIISLCKRAWEDMKREFSDIKAENEITEDLALSTDTRWQRLTERYFVINLEQEGTLRPTDFYAVLHEDARMNDFEVSQYKRYLERYGVLAKRLSTGTRPRIMHGLHLKETRREAPAF